MMLDSQKILSQLSTKELWFRFNNYFKKDVKALNDEEILDFYYRNKIFRLLVEERKQIFGSGLINYLRNEEMGIESILYARKIKFENNIDFEINFLKEEQ
jgi:hypothetical protein